MVHKGISVNIYFGTLMQSPLSREQQTQVFFANFPLYPHTHFYTHSHTFNSNFFFVTFFTSSLLLDFNIFSLIFTHCELTFLMSHLQRLILTFLFTNSLVLNPEFSFLSRLFLSFLFFFSDGKLFSHKIKFSIFFSIFSS